MVNVTQLGSQRLRPQATPIAGLGAVANPSDQIREELRRGLGLLDAGAAVAQSVGAEQAAEAKAQARFDEEEARKKQDLRDKYLKRQATTASQNLAQSIRASMRDDPSVAMLDHVQAGNYVDSRLAEAEESDPTGMLGKTFTDAHRNALLNQQATLYEATLEGSRKEIALGLTVGDYDNGLDSPESFESWLTGAVEGLSDPKLRPHVHAGLMETMRKAAADGDSEFLDLIQEVQLEYAKSSPVGSFLPQDSLDEFSKLRTAAASVKQTIAIEDNMAAVAGMTLGIGDGTVTLQTIADHGDLTDPQKLVFTNRLLAAHEDRVLEAEEKVALTHLLNSPAAMASASQTDADEATAMVLKGMGLVDIGQRTPEQEAEIVELARNNGSKGIPKMVREYLGSPTLSNLDVLEDQVALYRRIRGTSGSTDSIPGMRPEVEAVYRVLDVADRFNMDAEVITTHLRELDDTRALRQRTTEFRESSAFQLFQDRIGKDAGWAWNDLDVENFNSVARDLVILGTYMSAGGASDEVVADSMMKRFNGTHSTVQDFNGTDGIMVLPVDEENPRISSGEALTSGFKAIFLGSGFMDELRAHEMSTKIEDYTLVPVWTDRGQRRLAIQSLVNLDQPASKFLLTTQDLMDGSEIWTSVMQGSSPEAIGEYVGDVFRTDLNNPTSLRRLRERREELRASLEAPVGGLLDK